MDIKRWQKIESILDQALLLDDPDKAMSYIKDACSNNEQLFEEVASLMESIRKAQEENFLEDI